MDPVAAATQLVTQARAVCVLTGAGISTDSGIPDFRGPNGLWTRDPEAERSATIANYVAETAVRVRAWQRFSDGVWSDREPNNGHRALVNLERQGRLHTLITQNVDGLHERAGTSPEKLVEIHGTITKAVCLGCDRRWPIADIVARVRQGDVDPHCEHCDGILKSATISFGQNLVARDLERAERAAQECDVMLAVGTSLTVTPIAYVVPIASRAGARVVIVNAQPTPYDALAEVCVREGISSALPVICAPLSDAGRRG